MGELNFFAPDKLVRWREIVSPMSSSDLSTAASQRTNGAMVSQGFFQTLGIGLIRDRGFEWSDDQRHPRLAIVSRTLAKRLFPHADAFSQHIRFGVMPDLQDMEIVGIANDARVFDLRDASIPVVYLPILQHPDYTQWGDLFVRTSEPPEALAKTAAALALLLASVGLYGLMSYAGTRRPWKCRTSRPRPWRCSA